MSAEGIRLWNVEHVVSRVAEAPKLGHHPQDIKTEAEKKYSDVLQNLPSNPH